FMLRTRPRKAAVCVARKFRDRIAVIGDEANRNTAPPQAANDPQTSAVAAQNDGAVSARLGRMHAGRRCAGRFAVGTRKRQRIPQLRREVRLRSMSDEIHSLGLSMQANRATGSEWIERRSDLAFPLPRSLRNISATRSAVNAQPALSITAAGSFA